MLYGLIINNRVQLTSNQRDLLEDCDQTHQIVVLQQRAGFEREVYRAVAWVGAHPGGTLVEVSMGLGVSLGRTSKLLNEARKAGLVEVYSAWMTYGWVDLYTRSNVS